MLQIENESSFQDLANLLVIGCKDPKEILDHCKQSKGSIFLDEFILEKDEAGILVDTAVFAKTLPNLLLVWVAMAGYRGFGDDFDPASLPSILPLFCHANLSMPLRTTKAVLDGAGVTVGRRGRRQQMSQVIISMSILSLPSPSLLVCYHTHGQFVF